jgi:phage-related protein
MTEQNTVVNTDASDDVLPELTQEQILGNAAAEYVKLEAKVAEVKAQLKALETQQKNLKDIFKANRSGEANEIIKIKRGRATYLIKFKDVSRQIMDQAAVKAEYAILGKAVPMKSSLTTTIEAFRA